MKKTLIIASSLLVSMMVSGAVLANPLSPSKDYPMNSDLQIVKSAGNNGTLSVIDHNPSNYSKQTIGNHTIESWLEDDIVYTKIDGNITTEYKINSDLEIDRETGSNSAVRVIDHNPSNHSKRTIGSHTIESWLQDDTVYTKIDGGAANTYKINSDLEIVKEGGSNNGTVRVIDHNPSR